MHPPSPIVPSRVGTTNMITENIELTQRQSEVFYLLAHGFNTDLIAEVLGISVGTVTNAISSVKKRLMTTSIHHTVSLLIASDYFSVTILSLSVMSVLLNKVSHVEELYYFDEDEHDEDEHDEDEHDCKPTFEFMRNS